MCKSKPLPLPRVEGGNLVVDMDEEDFRLGVNELQHSIVGRLFLTKGSNPPTTMELRAKLQSSWCVESFKLVPMGGGLHHIILQSMED